MNFCNDFSSGNKNYKIAFNLNVMQEIQQEYGSVAKWCDLINDPNNNFDFKALIFGFKAMLNEGIDIENEEKNTKKMFLTTKQVGRLISEAGFEKALKELTKIMLESTKSNEKNE